MQVTLEQPQEVHMWEYFAELVKGHKLDEHWPTISVMTNKILLAVRESAENGCRVIDLKL